MLVSHTHSARRSANRRDAGRPKLSVVVPMPRGEVVAGSRREVQRTQKERIWLLPLQVTVNCKSTSRGRRERERYVGCLMMLVFLVCAGHACQVARPCPLDNVCSSVHRPNAISVLAANHSRKPVTEAIYPSLPHVNVSIGQGACIKHEHWYWIPFENME